MVLLTGKTQLILAFSILGLVACGGNAQSYLNRGNHFAQDRNYGDAALQYQKAIQKAPTLGEAHYRLALLDLTVNQPVAAYRELQRAVELMPGNDEALAKLAQLALSIYNADPKHPRQLYDKADKAAGKLLNRSPAGFDGNLVKGAIALADRKPADAVRFLRKAVEVKPQDTDAQLGLARALVQDNQAPAGISIARNLISKNKAFGPAYDFLYEQYQTSKKADDAENILKLKVANNPAKATFILELGRYYAAMQKPSEVTSTIDKLTAKPTDFPDGRLLAGDFYSSVGKPEMALQQYNTGISSASTKKDIYRKRMFKIFASQQRWTEASQQVETILKEQPADEEAKLMRALAWLDEGKPANFDPALAELRSQVVKHPNDPALHFQEGNGLARKADQEGARREWTAAAQANRNYLPPRFALVQLNLSQGKSAEALQVSDEIIAAAPRDAQASLLHATCLTAVGQYQRARTEFNRLSSEYPAAGPVHFQTGMLDLAEHKYKEAEGAFRQIEGALAKDPQVLAALAEALQGEKQGAKAIQLLQNELQRLPNSMPLRQILARTASATGRYDIALDQYKQLAAAAPDSSQAQFALAAAFTAKGDGVDAQGVLEKVLQKDPGSVPASLMLAQSLLATGKVDAAKAHYRKAIGIQPNNANALNDLAFLMAESGEDLDKALTYARRGLQYAADPGLKASLADTLGWIYAKKNMNDSALQTFETLVRSNPGNATFRYHLGTTLYQKGERLKARKELQAALAAKPSAVDEPKIRELLARL